MALSLGNETVYLIVASFVIAGVVIGYVLLRRRRGMTNIRVEVLHPNLTYEVVKCPIEIGDEWKFEYGDKLITFTPQSIFEKTGIKGKKKVYFDTNKVLKFGDIDKTIGELSLTWTSKEINSFIKKKIAESKEQVKPLSRTEYAIILIFMGIQFVMMLVVAKRVGAI
jgi:preprotein translocase subunit SecG